MIERKVDKILTTLVILLFVSTSLAGSWKDTNQSTSEKVSEFRIGKLSEQFATARMETHEGRFSGTFQPTVVIDSPEDETTLYTRDVTIHGFAYASSPECKLTYWEWTWEWATGSTGNSSYISPPADMVEFWIDIHGLWLGANVITVTFYDACGLQGSDQITIYYEDIFSPTVVITYPEDGSEFDEPHITVQGHAADVEEHYGYGIGIVELSWHHTWEGGEEGDRQTFEVPVIEVTFSIPIALRPGENTIEVTAVDLAGNIGKDDVTVYYTAPAIPGLFFYQVDYLFNDSSEIIDSYIGQVIVDVDLLTSYYGLPSGYLNILTPLGWVIQNIYISSDFTNEEVPYVSTGFRLREGPVDGVDVDSIDVYISFSPTPMCTPPDVHYYMTYPVGSITRYVNSGYYVPPVPVLFDFDPNKPNQQIVQRPTHPNVQAACGQCGPAAAANSLQWLEDKYEKIRIPHENQPGICKTGGNPNPPNSLVAQLDKYMERRVMNRKNGKEVNCEKFLRGKLKYLNEVKNDDPQENEKLGQYIKVKHQSFFVPLQKDITEGTVTSRFKGEIDQNLKGVSFEFIFEELEKGEDVEALLTRPGGGGHWVNIVGAGTTNGVKWIKFQSDEVQANFRDGDNLLFPRGVPGFNVDPTKTVILPANVREWNDGKGHQALRLFNEPGYGGWFVTFVVTQSPNNPPNKPDKPKGPARVKPGERQTYTTKPTTDPDGDMIRRYEWDLDGDGKVDKETDKPSVNYTWNKEGTYKIRVRARDEYGAVSNWSDPLIISVQKSKCIKNLWWVQWLFRCALNHDILAFKLFQILFLLLYQMDSPV